MMSNSQVDRLGKDLREGVITADHLKRLEAFRSEFVPAYKYVEDLLVHKLRLKITGRPSKSTVAILEKLRRETVRLSQIQDVAGCRILVPNMVDQDRVVATLDVMLGQPIVDDKRESPTNGYRAVHLIPKIDGRPVEIQIRTAPQHGWAEISEKLADTYGQSIKYGLGDPVPIDFLASLSVLTRRLEHLRVDRAKVERSIRNFAKRLREVAMLKRREALCIEEIHQLFLSTIAKVA